MVEKKVLKLFLHKKIVFKRKSKPDVTLVGVLEEVFDTTAVIKFKGQLQSHPLEDIEDDVSEGFSNEGDDND